MASLICKEVWKMHSLAGGSHCKKVRIYVMYRCLAQCHGGVFLPGLRGARLSHRELLCSGHSWGTGDTENRPCSAIALEEEILIHLSQLTV